MEWFDIAPTETELKKHKIDIDNGNYFGFPPCCIDYFIKSHIRWARISKKFKKNNAKWEEMVKHHSNYLFSERKNEPWEHIHRSSGFIPCPKCSKKLYISGECISTLIHNRKCSVSFKNSSY